MMTLAAILNLELGDAPGAVSVQWYAPPGNTGARPFQVQLSADPTPVRLDEMMPATTAPGTPVPSKVEEPGKKAERDIRSSMADV